MHNPISSWAIRGFSSIENKGFLKPYQSILLWRNNSPINSSSLPIPRTSGSVRPSSIRVFGFSCTEKVSLPLQIAWPTKIFTKPIKKKSTPNPQNEKKKKKWNEIKNKPGKSHGSNLQTSASGMTAAGRGEERAFFMRYCRTSSSSVGWKRKPGGNRRTPFLRKVRFSMDGIWGRLGKKGEELEMEGLIFIVI